MIIHNLPFFSFIFSRIEPTPLSHSTVSTSTPLNDGGGWEGDSKEDEDKGGDKEEFDATMQMLKAQGWLCGYGNMVVVAVR